MNRGKGLFFAASRLRSYLDATQYDVIHSSGFRADVLSSMVACRIMRVCTRHELFHSLHVAWHGPVLGRIMEYLHCRALSRMDYIVVCSETVKQSAPKRLQEKIAVIRNCVDYGVYRPADPEEKRILRAELGLPAHCSIIVFMGRVDKCKDVATVIAGFLRSRFHDKAFLVIVGDGPAKRYCEELAGNAPRITFVGFSKQAEKYLRAADIYVSASWLEGLPLSVIEALACGLPCVVSDIGAHRELASLVPGVVLFPTQDAVGLARALERGLAADPCESRIATEIVRERLGPEIMAQSYREIFESMIRVRPSDMQENLLCES